MPYDPANFSFSYSHSHRNTSGETTVYENEDQWRGSLAYTWTPVFKAWEPFKKLIKSKSKYFDILKRFGLNWLPQNVTFNTDIMRNYYELQERDMESLDDSQLPLTFSEQFLWNREFSIRWDLTKNLHFNFQSATHAEIEEPYTPINKDLYPDQYDAWKDSVWTSIRNWGAPLDYSQTVSASYKLPLNLIPIFDWINADASYNDTYGWVRGTDLEDGTSLGNSISTKRSYNLNGTFNLQKLYDHVPFLKATNDRFSKNKPKKAVNSKTQNPKKMPETKGGAKDGDDKDGAKGKGDAKNKGKDPKANLPKNKKSFEKEITIKADTSMVITHGKKTKRFEFSAKTLDGKPIHIRYKKLDDNKIQVYNPTDSTLKFKITVTPKEPLDEKGWYRTAQSVARVLMMVRNVSLSYRNQYTMGLPGFMPTIGNAFGQRRGDIMAPGLDFGFGLIDDDYIEKARERGWLLSNDNVATPATTSLTEDLQLKMTLEPVRDFKIDLNASRNVTKAKSVQYMYAGNPTTQSGSFNMTTIAIKTAFASSGDANNGYSSKTFEKFCQSLPAFRERVEARYANTVYPQGTALAGKTFNPENGGVGAYSADVLVPAFLSSYTSMGGGSLDIFPTLSRLLPNWTVRYSGLGRLPWFSSLFKSVNLNHSYKCLYAVGSYASYSTWMESTGGLGFITDATTGNPVPNSMFNVSTVSLTENFAPLLGVDVTLNNNLTCKLEYKTTRQLSLSMTSVQLNETTSKDWVIGMGYKINDFKLFGGGGTSHRKVKGGKKNAGDNDENASKNQNTNNNRNGKGSFNHDLNLRFDFSYRQQANITRDIASMTSSASSGNTALKFSFSADYTLSKLMTMTFYYDQQTNTPLLSANSYPTTTRDFGLSLKFSLTR